MSRKIALTGIGVVNGSFEGTDRLNQKLYDGSFDESLFEESLFGENRPDDLIDAAVKDVRSELFKDGFKETAVIQVTDKASIESGFKSVYVETDILTAIAKAVFVII